MPERDCAVDTRSSKKGVDPITWLASYPRSGNTLLRIILKHCFELDSYSLYSDQEFPVGTVQDLVGEKPIGPDADSFLRRLSRNGGHACVKTHELPGADARRTIYIVRDGRAALVSHYHYFRDVLGLNVTLEEVISGQYFHSWSAHARAWMLSERPHILPIRFEALKRGEPEALGAIGHFLEKKQLRSFSSSFSQLQTLMPTFFRSGSDSANIAEFSGSQLELFETLHGEVWRTLGYAERA